MTHAFLTVLVTTVHFGGAASKHSDSPLVPLAILAAIAIAAARLLRIINK